MKRFALLPGQSCPISLSSTECSVSGIAADIFTQKQAKTLDHFREPFSSRSQKCDWYNSQVFYPTLGHLESHGLRFVVSHFYGKAMVTIVNEIPCPSFLVT